MLRPEVIASGRGLSLNKSSESQYAIQTGRHPESGVTLFALAILLAVVSLGFAGVAIRPLFHYSGPRPDAGGIIGVFLLFAFMALMCAIPAALAFQRAVRNWYGQIMTIELQTGVVSVQHGPRCRKVGDVSEVEAISMSRDGKHPHFFRLCLRMRLPCSQVVFHGRQDIEIEAVQLGYPMTAHHAELTTVGQALAEILKVPFKADAFDSSG